MVEQTERGFWRCRDLLIPPGTVIDKFEVVELLGQGAMASVYLVRHIHLDAPYALKVLQIHRPEVAERLLTEGRVQAALRHPNVVGVSDVILVEGQPGLVLEFVDGPTLESFIQDYGPLPVEQIDHIAMSMAKGLRAAHRAGHLHRDLKPANILMDYLDDHWIPKIADFGLAKFLHGDGGEVSVTRTGQIMGSPTFMSPEQCRDAKAVDERADVFALGAVAYELVTQQRCFDAPDVVSVFARIVSGAFIPVSDLRPDLPPAMVSAIHGALVVDREHRIPSVDAFMEVWSGRRTFEANQQDATESVVALLGESASGTYATLNISRVPTPAPVQSRPKKALVRPASVVGSMAFLSVVAMLAVGALLTGFVMVYLGAAFVQPDRPRLVVTPPPVQPTASPEPAVVLVEPTPEPDVKPDTPAPVDPQPAAPDPDPVPQPVRPDPVPDPLPEPQSVPEAKVFSFQAVDAVLSKNAALRLCFDEAKKAGVSMPTVVKIRFLVTADGGITAASIATPSLAGGPLEQCVRSSLASITFDPGPGRPTPFTYPILP